MKVIEYYLTLKNGLSLVVGICVLLLAVIPLRVSPDHLLWLRWESAIVLLAILAVLGLFWQAHLQSREEHDRAKNERARDNALVDLQRSLTPPPTPRSPAPSNAITRSVPHAPGTFDSVAFFRTAYLSPLQDVGANSYIAEAERVRPNDKASFYLDVLAVGSIQMLYDDLWWTSYRSQIYALGALNKASGVLPIQDFRKPFDDAAIEFADDYAKYGITFEKWTNFMETSMLVTTHPSKMVEITLKGRDFLKYLLHHGRDIEAAKRL